MSEYNFYILLLVVLARAIALPRKKEERRASLCCSSCVSIREHDLQLIVLCGLCNNSLM